MQPQETISTKQFLTKTLLEENHQDQHLPWTNKPVTAKNLSSKGVNLKN
jgi:hypothetical protein